MIKIRNILWVALVALLGCNGDTNSTLDDKEPYKGVRIKVLTPDKPGLHSWLEDQRGEWEAETGGSVSLANFDSLADLNNVHNADIVIYHSGVMGEVATTIREMPEALTDDPRFESNDFPSVVQEHLTTWNRRNLAIPLMVSTPIVYYRHDLFADETNQNAFQKQYGRTLQAPKTWDEFDKVARFFTGKDLDGNGEPDRGVVLLNLTEAFLCRAAAFAKQAENLSFHFDVNSMGPLILEAPWIASLEAWVAVADSVATVGDTEQSIRSFQNGSIALAIGSSRYASDLLRRESSAVAEHTTCSRIPGSMKLYDRDNKMWSHLDDDATNRSAIVDGWVASVLKTSNRKTAAAAFDFLIFLTAPDRSAMGIVVPEFEVGPFRMSHLNDPSMWTVAEWPSKGIISFLACMRANLSELNAVSQLRIRGAAEYHKTLRVQLMSAMKGTQTASEALESAAEAWREISTRRGHDEQRRQYRYSLGMPVID